MRQILAGVYILLPPFVGQRQHCNVPTVFPTMYLPVLRTYITQENTKEYLGELGSTRVCKSALRCTMCLLEC